MFEAKIETISELFQYGNAKGAFTIPIYQRDYRWGNDEVRRLMDDIKDGLTFGNDFKRFIGAVIFVESKEDGFNSPVLSLIDGQQRITTITLLLVSLYEYLKEKHLKETDRKKSVDINNMLDNIVELLVGTSIRKAIDKGQIYPKIIREGYDLRKTNGKYLYKSSIASLLHAIGCSFYEVGNYETDNHEIKDISDKVINNKNEIKKYLKSELIEKFGVDKTKEYIFNNILFTTVIVKNEDYAFDIFESLNSTGEPLTAIETFIPLVVKNNDNYKNSDVKKCVDKVLSFIRDKENTQGVSTDLVLWQSLLFDGYNINSKHLSVQRKHLREKYNNIIDKDKSFLYIETFSNLVDFIKNKWDDNEYDSSSFEKLALSFLNKTKTSLLIPILTRFYKENNFNEYLKATVAFFVLWRSYTYGTGRIDHAFKEILSSISYLSGGGIISVNDYKLLLIKLLENKIKDVNNDTKKTWLLKAKNSTFGRNFRPIGKFILLAAHENSESIVVNGKRNGLIKVNETRSINKWLSYENFLENKEIMEIEHISPQRVSNGWDNSIYQDKDTIHLIGNLTLLSKSSNSMKSNMSPDHTRIFYQALASGNKAKLDNLIKDNKKVFTTNAKIYLNESYKHEFLTSLESIDFKKWNDQFILERSENIMSLAWDTIYPWLSLHRKIR